MRNFGGNIHEAKTMRRNGVLGTKKLKFFNIPFKHIPSLDFILWGIIWGDIVAINSFNIGYFRVPKKPRFQSEVKGKTLHVKQRIGCVTIKRTFVS